MEHQEGAIQAACCICEIFQDVALGFSSKTQELSKYLCPDCALMVAQATLHELTEAERRLLELNPCGHPSLTDQDAIDTAKAVDIMFRKERS